MSSARASALLLAASAIASTTPRAPLRVNNEHSAEYAWRQKAVSHSRTVDDMHGTGSWILNGSGKMTFRADGERRRLRVDINLQGQKALPNATARLRIPAADWTPYNRISMWLRTEAAGFPVLTLMATIVNEGKPARAEVHRREATHQITIPKGKWVQVLWEIPHLERDRVTALDIRPWVNKLLAAPWDSAAYEIGSIELQKVVQPDVSEGWQPGERRIAFSHSGYLPGSSKTAIARGLAEGTFAIKDARWDRVVFTGKVEAGKSRIGSFQILDFSSFRTPGNYTIHSGNVKTPPFRIADDVWLPSLEKTVNFFYGERCGMEIPGLHEACHRDWQATLGDKKIVMNGGWHDAGDLSQGLVNTGESTHAMFALAAELGRTKRNPELLRMLVDEAKWGLDWIHKVRFPGGYRIGFASMNIWTNGILGDEDDRTRAALNNPNVNYIAAAAGAAAYRYLRESEPELAKKALAIAEDDWRYAITGIEGPDTWSTPAFAASEMELASIGAIASIELYRATGRDEYARKAQELARVILASQQKDYAGSDLPLAGFFYTGPDRRDIFHQFHRGNDQAPLVALSMLCDAFPNHSEWIDWYASAAFYAEYQKRSAKMTQPYGVLPAYVYRDDAWERIAENDRYGSSKEDYRQQVLGGWPMGGGYYLKAFPVWFTRRGNYGPLLSQTKALSAVARLRADRDAAELVQRQLEWVVGRNPFTQSTMWGEGYHFAPQYSVSVGDMVGELPVGIMTRGNGDVPYWPATNSYVYKEVWVHSSARWLWILQDVLAPSSRPAPGFTVTHTKAADGAIRITASAPKAAQFTLRSHNLEVQGSDGKWTARVQNAGAPWIAVVIADGDATRRREITGY